MNKLFLPNYQDCLDIVENNDTFVHKIHEYNGVKVSVFNYGLSSHSDFFNPVKDRPELDALELRGITFVHDSETPNRFLALRKFFNINQTIGSMYDDVKHKNILRVQDKADGSMISFIRVNGETVTKTKQSLSNEQTKMVDDFLSKNSNYRDFVEACLDSGLMPIFELVSPFNFIVLRYNSTDMQLLQLRDLNTGEYVNIYENFLVSDFNIKCADKVTSYTLEDLLIERETLEDIEGWVVTFEDGFQVKIKTLWYLALHKLITENLNQENYLIEATLREFIDDGLAQLDKDNPLKVYAEEVANRTVHYFHSEVNRIKECLSTYDGDRKSFALKHKDTFENFSIMMRCLDDSSTENVEEHLKNYIIKKTNKLGKAQEFTREKLGLRRDFTTGISDEC